MAVNGSSMSVAQSLIPIFKGECYEFWSIKMKTLFRSQDLWDLVESRFYEKDNDEGQLKENKKKDSKALFIIQQAIHDTIFFENCNNYHFKGSMGYTTKRISRLFKGNGSKTLDSSKWVWNLDYEE